MKIALLLLATATLFVGRALAQDPNAAMVKECEATASSDDDRAACARLAQCASQCGGDDSCIFTCTAPSRVTRVPPFAQPVISRPQVAPSPAKGQTDPGEKAANCKEALAYEANGLMQDFNHALSNVDLFKEAQVRDFTYARRTLNLMNEQWLIGETGAQIAIEVRFVTNEVNALLKVLVPGESTALDLIEKGGVTLGILRSAVENGAKQASEDGAKEAFWVLGEEISPLVAIEHGFLDKAANEAAMEDYKAEVQTQVAVLVKSAKKWHDKEIEAQSKARAIADLQRQIETYCRAKPGLDIPPR
jgi:hypothetical protein